MSVAKTAAQPVNLIVGVGTGGSVDAAERLATAQQPQISIHLPSVAIAF